jgi:lipocalin-like protein
MMRRLIVTAMTATFLLHAGSVVLGNSALAQSAKEQIVGAWTLVSADSVFPDGRRVQVFGPNPQGMMIFSRDGQFALVQMRAGLPRIAANSRAQGSAEENKAIVEGSIAYFGRYSLNEADKVMIVRLEGSTFANLLEMAEQKRLITVLTQDELKFENPRTPSGATLEVVWRRAR